LVITLGNILFDAADVLAPGGPEQPAQVSLSVATDIFASNQEVMAEHVAKFHEASRHAAEAASVIFYLAELAGAQRPLRKELMVAAKPAEIGRI
jgi:hypothetical protein